MNEKLEKVRFEMLKAAESFLFQAHKMGDLGFVRTPTHQQTKQVDGYLLCFPEGRIQSLGFSENPDGTWSRIRCQKDTDVYYWDKFMAEHPDDLEVRRWFLISLENMMALHFVLREKGES